MKRIILVATLALSSATTFGADASNIPTATTAPTRIDVDALVKKLSSADYAEREDAAAALLKAYPGHAAEIDAAAKRPDLDPQAAMTLDQIVGLQKPRREARERREKRLAESEESDRATALGAYDRLGNHDPAWDAAAREFLQAYWAPDAGGESRADRQARCLGMVNGLDRAGCKDPLVMYFMARVRQRQPGADPHAVARAYRAAAAAMEASNYPDVRKCYAQLRYVHAVLRGNVSGMLKNWKRELGASVDRAVARWPAVVADASVDDRSAAEIADLLDWAWQMVKAKGKATYGDRGELCDRLFPAWETARPKSAAPWYFKGNLYVSFAWAARGSGPGNAVSPDGARLMRERLQVAEAALRRAYELEPADARAAARMINVQMGLGRDRDQMETWFRRAMAADPDNYYACTNKLTYLEPKWLGSAPEMLAFGRECLNGGNWDGRIPLILAEVHRRLAEYADDHDAYLARPAVWADIRAAYEPYLARFPDASTDRSYYAHFAFHAGQWAEANRQFEILGDDVDFEPFGTKEACQQIRAYVKEMAARQNATTGGPNQP